MLAARSSLRRVVRLFAMLAVVAVFALPGSVAEAADAPPSSMSALGDSITRGFNTCGFFFDCTNRSWSTGTYSTIKSHYQRILAINPSISGKNYNDAKTGAKMADLAGQASTAVSRKVQYVTILIGANDACTSSESMMTQVPTFRSQLDQALATLKNGLPLNAKVFISSIPDAYRLWDIGKNSSSARSAWSTYKI